LWGKTGGMIKEKMRGGENLVDFVDFYNKLD
jgi:hypothetical protein